MNPLWLCTYPPDCAWLPVAVSNAGMGLIGPIECQSIDEMRNVMDTNFFGLVRLLKEVLPDMKRRKKGHIVVISSVMGIQGKYSSSCFRSEPAIVTEQCCNSVFLCCRDSIQWRLRSIQVCRGRLLWKLGGTSPEISSQVRYLLCFCRGVHLHISCVVFECQIMLTKLGSSQGSLSELPWKFLQTSTCPCVTHLCTYCTTTPALAIGTSRRGKYARMWRITAHPGWRQVKTASFSNTIGAEGLCVSVCWPWELKVWQQKKTHMSRQSANNLKTNIFINFSAGVLPIQRCDVMWYWQFDKPYKPADRPISCLRSQKATKAVLFFSMTNMFLNLQHVCDTFGYNLQHLFFKLLELLWWCFTCLHVFHYKVLTVILALRIWSLLVSSLLLRWYDYNMSSPLSVSAW